MLDQAKFDGIDLISGSAATGVTIQSGSDATDTTGISIDALSAATLNVEASDIKLDTGKAEIHTFTGITDAMVESELDDASTAITLEIDGTSLAVSVTDPGTTTLAELVTGLNTAAAGRGITFSEASPTGDGTLIVTGDAGSGALGDLTISFGATSQTFNGVITTSATGIQEIDAALATIASDRATLGATQAQLESTVRNLANVAENTAAAAGRIMDTDYAAETANLTKAQILQQAATSILAQANAQPQAVLSLLQ